VVCRAEPHMRPPKNVAENYSKTLQEFEKGYLVANGSFSKRQVQQAKGYLQVRHYNFR